jgi:hypothetical protein
VAPLWGWVPEVAIYNTALLAALTLATYGMFCLLRELTGDDVAALAGGILYASVPYHMAHLSAHLYYVSTGWLPLYLLHLLRVVRGADVVRNGLRAGVFLALASLASWYHFIFAGFLSLPILFAGRRAVLTPAFVRGALAALATFVVLAGPFLAAMLAARAHEDLVGGHDPAIFSADLQSFVYPNAAQRWGQTEDAAWRTWVGSPVENATYVGWGMLALAVAGIGRDAHVRPFLALAIVAAVLSLGPVLHVGGHTSEGRLPYWYLQHLVPAFEMTGVPVRFGYVMYFGLAVGAAFGLTRLRALAERRGRAASAAVTACAVALVLAEYWPRPLGTWSYPTPAPLRAWADDPGRWAVIDAWDFYRPMWHATLHRKAMIDGHISRTPKRLIRAVYDEPVLRAIRHGGAGGRLETQVPTVDMSWKGGAPGDLAPYALTATWSGTLVAPTDGVYEFWLRADDAATLTLDYTETATIEACAGAAPCEAHATRKLRAGTYPVRVRYERGAAAGDVHLEWQPPGRAREIVPTSALRTAANRAGLDAVYTQRIPETSGLGRDAGRATLRALDVRYVILNARPNACVEDELTLPLVYSGEGVRIFEVPAD